MPAAGHLLRLGPREKQGNRRKAALREADRALAAGRDRPRALHPLLPLCALQPGGRRGRPAAADRARRPHLRRHLRRAPLRRPLPRQHHRHLPGRGADQLHLPLPRPALGHRARRLGLHALPESVQRQLHRPRREGETGRHPRQRRGRRRLDLRPRPLRVRDVRRARAGARAAAEGRRGRVGRGAAGRCRGPAAGRRQGRGDRRRRLQRGGLPAAAAPPRGARLAAPRLAPLARAAGRRPAAAGRAGRSPPGCATSTKQTRSWCSAPTRCTARRSSTCGSARRSAATAPSWWSRPSGRPRSTAAPRRSPVTPRARRPLRRELASAIGGAENVASPVAETLREAGKVVVIWGERIAREPGAAQALLDVARRPTDGAAAGNPRHRQRPRPARGRRPPRRGPGLSRRRRGNVHRGDPSRR